MDATKILKADILDILFENRNKDYGAYNLRKTYNSRIITALAITGSLAAFLFIASFAKPIEKNDAKIDIRDVVIEEIKTDDKKPDPPPITPPKQEVPQVEHTKLTNIKIVEDDQVKKEDLPPDVTTLADTKIDVVNIKGTKDPGLATPPVIDDNKNVVEVPKAKENEPEIFDKVEIEAEFPGGLSAWSRYLQNKLNSNTPAENGAPNGSYTVVVQFIVDKQGNISDVKALTNHGYGMEEEAIRVIKRGPQWTPAIQNGRNVNAYRKQPITFIVAE
ncbi:energy transducer TonB [Chitinophagaceae bacterium LB-8]|uniref:Energy transducer TonB n=1 Tax=Paraflavisolibacter caeni TaxID=2982496 RepID=A0A9X2XSA0_9BACT|nr:energy transducer TonB [Paraflavisolibacter caeni]MCU7548104.1 energy transducer TonB [Paraflavisolibacter caeni]